MVINSTQIALEKVFRIHRLVKRGNYAAFYDIKLYKCYTKHMKDNLLNLGEILPGKQPSSDVDGPPCKVIRLRNTQAILACILYDAVNSSEPAIKFSENVIEVDFHQFNETSKNADEPNTKVLDFVTYKQRVLEQTEV